MSRYRGMKGYDALDDIDRRLSDIERRLLTQDEPRAFGNKPSETECKVYFQGHAREELWQAFWFHFEANGWTGPNGKPLANWRARADKWMLDNPKAAEPPKREPLRVREGELARPADSNAEPIAKEEIDRIRRRLANMTGIGREMPECPR